MRYAGATNDERLRLFYVALTRARSQLYLTSYARNYAGTNTNHLKYLEETSDGETLQSPLLPAGQQQVLPAENNAPTPSTELTAYWQQRHEAALTQTDMQALVQERLARYQLSPTHLNDFIDVAYCGPQAFFVRTILRFPQAPRAEVQFGNAMHETLEWMHTEIKTKDKLPAESTVAIMFERRLRMKQLREHDTELFLDRGRDALQAYLQQRRTTISADNVAEHNFRNEGVLLGKAHLTGKIDKLIIDRQAKTIVIVDYKTGKGHHRWTRDIRLHKYRQQLYLYKLLVEGSHSFAGYTVTGAYLEFVEPDEDGMIQTLQLTFDPDEQHRVARLAQAVWQRITNLQLPDVTAYSNDLAGVEAFEADLLHQD
jgi:ATP-dependent exoDNAse (exonuclease V) beta subunit